MAWLTGYKYRKEISITSAVGAGTDWVVPLEVYAESGTDAAGVAYLSGHSESFPDVSTTVSDIRFTDDDGSTELYHTLERIDRGSANKLRALYRIRVEDDLSSNQKIYLYYGKTSPGTSGHLSDSDTFTTGANFDDGSTTGLTINTADTGAATVPTPTQMHNKMRVDHPYKYYSNPVISLGAGGSWNEKQCRDLGILIDSSNNAVIESGNIIGYIWGKSAAGAFTIGRFTSSDGGFTWAEYGSNPVLSKDVSAHEAGGLYTAHVLYLPGVGPDTDKPYKMLYMSMNAGKTIQYYNLAESADGLTFTRYGSNPLFNSTEFKLPGGGNSTAFGSGQLIMDGSTYVLIGEIYDGTDGFHVAGTTSSNLTSWTHMNIDAGKGTTILSDGGAGAWDDDEQANPKIVKIDTNKFVLSYNGRRTTTAWEIGFAHGTDSPVNWDTNTWTKHANNPLLYAGVAGRWDVTAIECAAMLVDDLDDGTSYLRFWYQGEPADDSTQIGVALFPQGRLLYGASQDADDGYVVGEVLGAGNFMMEINYWLSRKGVTPNGADTIGLIDDTGVPVPEVNTTYNPKIRFGVWPFVTGANEDMYVIWYKMPDDTNMRWDGAAWDAATTYHGHEGQVKIKIWDDGTNYKCDILDALTGVSILANVASIAKASVKSFSYSRVFHVGDPYDSHYYYDAQYDNWFLAPFSDPEPIVGTPGSEESYMASSCSCNARTLIALGVI